MPNRVSGLFVCCSDHDGEQEASAFVGRATVVGVNGSQEKQSKADERSESCQDDDSETESEGVNPRDKVKKRTKQK
jgi:hypothetical protein